MTLHCPNCGGRIAPVVKNAALTRTQNLIVSFVRLYEEQKGRGPRVSEIGAALGFKSVNGIYHTIRALRREGHLTLAEQRASLTEKGRVSCTNSASSAALRMPTAASKWTASPCRESPA